jgi:hypothetical protein
MSARDHLADAQARIDAMCGKVDACLARVKTITSPVPATGPKGGRPRLTPPNETLAERARLLRANGASFGKIAAALGIAKAEAHRLATASGARGRKTDLDGFGRPVAPAGGTNGAGQPLAAPERVSAARRGEG